MGYAAAACACEIRSAPPSSGAVSWHPTKRQPNKNLAQILQDVVRTSIRGAACVFGTRNTLQSSSATQLNFKHNHTC